MKNKKFLLPICTLLLILTSAFTAFASTGWTQVGDDWYYYTSDNTPEYNVWRKAADGKYRYVGYDGKMAKNAWVDDTYFVDETGTMLTEKWKKLFDGDDSYWFYFNASGKKVTEKWQKVSEKWYYFDESGHMLTGWILDNTYYCGDEDDGAMKTGWRYVQDPDYDEDEYAYSPFESEGDGKHYYYFQGSGKVLKPTGDDEYLVNRKIGDYKYCFDSKGAMQTGWVKVYDNAESEIQNYKYYNTDGSLRTGWYSLNPPEDLENNYDYSVMWFYFLNDGKPQAHPGDQSNYTIGELKKISGKTYLFNEYGNPIYGLAEVSGQIYYFGTTSSMCMMTGKQSVIEASGERATYCFATNGQGITGVKDSYLYYKGKLQTTDGSYTYMAITLDDANYYLVSSAGKIQKSISAKKKIDDGIYVTTNANGIITKMYERVGSTSTYNEISVSSHIGSYVSPLSEPDL